MNVNGDFEQTNSNCDDIFTPEDMKEDNPSEEGLSCYIGEYDWVHGFSKGDVVWSPGFELCHQAFKDRGDESDRGSHYKR